MDEREDHRRKYTQTMAKKGKNRKWMQPFYLYKIDFACADVVIEESIKCSVVPVTVSHAHGRTRLEVTQEGPMLANATKTAKLQ